MSDTARLAWVLTTNCAVERGDSGYRATYDCGGHRVTQYRFSPTAREAIDEATRSWYLRGKPADVLEFLDAQQCD